MLYSNEVLELLNLTGQTHDDQQRVYDRVYGFWSCDRNSKQVVGAMGFLDDGRVVDIAVHPNYRRFGIAKTMVALSGCTKAYAVNELAEKFWQGIGWKYSGTAVDKGMLVKVYIKETATNT